MDAGAHFRPSLAAASLLAQGEAHTLYCPIRIPIDCGPFSLLFYRFAVLLVYAFDHVSFTLAHHHLSTSRPLNPHAPSTSPWSLSLSLRPVILPRLTSSTSRRFYPLLFIDPIQLNQFSSHWNCQSLIENSDTHPRIPIESIPPLQCPVNKRE